MSASTYPRLGRYHIENEIGRGTMGVVYRAFDPKIDRVVAIKTIALIGEQPETYRQYRERFLQEARAAGRLSHPGIVTIYDSAEDSETGEPYIVMEHVSGEALSKITSGSDQKLPLHAALQLTQEIAEALDYAHSQGVIHRDIKPSNILITSDGHAKIADFGVAKLNQELLTQPGQIVGSPAYMAPEQMSGGEADARSDLFSLGVILYSMITGFRPFQGNSARTVCFKIMNVDPVPVTSFEHDVPPQVNALISRAIAKEPKDRYQSGAEMARNIQLLRTTDDLPAHDTAFFARAVQGSLVTLKPPKNRRLRRRQQLLWTAAVLALTTSGISLWGAHRLLRQSALEMRFPAPGLPAQFDLLSARAIRKPAKRHNSAAAKKPAVPAAPVAPADPTDAHIQVEIEHHFQAARASIWVDDNLVFEQNLRGATDRHPIFRTVEMKQVSNLDLKPGKHQLQVRVVSYPAGYDQVEMIDVDVSPASQAALLVNCDNHKKMDVSLQ